jgi:flagellar biosynthesis protein FlhG
MPFKVPMVRRLLEPDDQAAGLRRLLGDQDSFRALGLFGPDADLNAAAAAGLGYALTLRGGQVCLIDEAPGPRNVAGQLGLSPSHGLAEVARGALALDEALAPLPEGPRLLRAEQGLARVAEADDRYWNRLADDFAAGDWQWLLLAAPADERPSLALAAPRRILVLPAAKARLTEAYAVLKAAHQRQPDAAWLALFMNAGDEYRSEPLMAALNDTTRRFLGIEVGLLGTLAKDAQLDMAARSMRPIHQVAPSGPAALAFRQMAEQLHAVLPGAGMDARVFWQRLGLFARMNRIPRHQSARHVQHGRAYG